MFLYLTFLETETKAPFNSEMKSLLTWVNYDTSSTQLF